MAWSLNGKSVLITGAARGIGAESARQLVLLNRGWLWALSEGRTNREVPELDARFERLVAERGKDEASAAVGAGGAADERERALNRT